jgi:hypothetical protein
MPKKKKLHPEDTFVPTIAVKDSNPPLPRKSVDVKKATNGYVVSSYQDGKERMYIAKSHKEAQKHASRLLKL